MKTLAQLCLDAITSVAQQKTDEPEEEKKGEEWSVNCNKFTSFGAFKSILQNHFPGEFLCYKDKVGKAFMVKTTEL